MYTHMDRGPMKAWLHQIGRSQDPFCGCGATQNAAHLLESGCMWDGKRIKWEEI